MKKVPAGLLALLVSVLALAVAGCGPRPENRGSWREQGPFAPYTEKITVPANGSDVIDFELSFGAAEFQLAGDSIKPLAEGEVRYRSIDLKPVVEHRSGYARVSQRTRRVPFPDDWKSYWDLKLSTRYPMELDIAAGAFSGDFDFTGLRLRRLDMKTGASEGKVRFDKPNRERLDYMNIKTGASTLEMYGLLNANFDEMRFEGGAGDYRLNFEGPLRREAEVEIKAGVCDLTIEIPREVAARVLVRGALTSVSQGSFLVAGTREYVNSAYQGGREVLTIHVDMGIGSLSLLEID